MNSQIRGIIYSLHSAEDLRSKEVKGIPGKGIWFVLDFENRKIWFGQLEDMEE